MDMLSQCFSPFPLQDSVAVNAIECINRELDVNSDVDLYTLSLVAYANTLYDPTGPITATIMNRLNRNATLDGRQHGMSQKIASWWGQMMLT